METKETIQRCKSFVFAVLLLATASSLVQMTEAFTSVQTTSSSGPQHLSGAIRTNRLYRDSSNLPMPSLGTFPIPIMPRASYTARCASNTEPSSSSSSASGEQEQEEEQRQRRRFESPLRVRRKVKAVLQKARKRTRHNDDDDDDGSTNSLSSMSEVQQSDVYRTTTTMEDMEHPSLVNDESHPSQPHLNGKTVVTASAEIVDPFEANGVNGEATPSSLPKELDEIVNNNVTEVNGDVQEEPLNGSIATTDGPTLTPNGVGTKVTNGIKVQDSVSPPAPESTTTTMTTETEKAEPKVEALPFDLPNLTNAQKSRLLDGERIQEQSKMGREGSGYVVLDVNVPPYVVWECLLDFESYPQIIPTCRGIDFLDDNNNNNSDIATDGAVDESLNTPEGTYQSEKPVLPGTGKEVRHYGTASTTRASFSLSKFRLRIAAVHNYRPHPEGHYMVFTLDPESTNAVLQDAKGIWHTQSNPDGRGEVCTDIYLSIYVVCVGL